jgi:ADP-ribose pyrophosphatase YjhB (NUDIX family)
MKRFNILVGIIAIFGDDVLLLRRSLSEKFLPGAWGPPCGKIFFGERLEDAVRRELLEETALQVNKFKRMVGYSMFMSDKEGDELHNLQINYLIEVESAEPVILDKSNDDYKWIPIQECESAGLSEYALSTIKQAFDSHESHD